MSDADELVAFVKRCLDKDEQVAQRAKDLAKTRHWDSSPEGSVIDATVHTEYRYLAVGPDYRSLDDIGEHIARWDPARVLAEVAAKRRILDDYDIVVSAIRRVDDVDGNRLLYARLEARESDIRWLAQPYAGHEGWREEWRASAPA
jgi:hypothetical protein